MQYLDQKEKDVDVGTITRATQLKMVNWSQTKSEILILCRYFVLRLCYLSLFYQFDE